ncbi:MAG: hypothetical protein ACLSV2_14555 [Clostridium sp.]
MTHCTNKNYNKIILFEVKNSRNITESNLSDSEIITISLVNEAATIDPENALFNFVKNNFKELSPKIGSRTKLNLYIVIREIQSKFLELTGMYNSSIKIADSMYISLCKFENHIFLNALKI